MLRNCKRPLCRHFSLIAWALCSSACSSALDTASGLDGGAGKPEIRPGGPTVQTDVNIYTDQPVGWASVDALEQNGTSGGGDAAPTVVSTIEELTAAAGGTTPARIQVVASMTGSLRIGSNKTIEGTPGAVFTGHLGFNRSINVIVRDLVIVGFNCTDITAPETCENGEDAVTIGRNSHHIWVDHCDISDGSDGNLDVVDAADYVTVSFTKFWYRGRPGGHQFSNLISSSDSATGDIGHLKVTFHHDWWAVNVTERMPRVRYGQIHLFNNLYNSSGDLYCVGVGWNANVLLESNGFEQVSTPVDTIRFRNNASVAISYGNLYQNAFPAADLGTDGFTPPYEYTIEPAANVHATVSKNAGPRTP
jgi:pectate lyase